MAEDRLVRTRQGWAHLRTALAYRPFVTHGDDRRGDASHGVGKPRILAQSQPSCVDSWGLDAAEWIRPIVKGKLNSAGGFEPDTAESAVSSGMVDAVAFGRYFVSNPDLPRRIREKLPLAAYNRDTFYTFDALGYTDYPVYEDS